MNWKIKDEDEWSLTLTDERGEIVGFLKARTDEQKANARKAVVAPEAIALLERIAACPDCQRNHFDLMADIRRIIARTKEPQS